MLRVAGSRFDETVGLLPVYAALKQSAIRKGLAAFLHCVTLSFFFLQLFEAFQGLLNRQCVRAFSANSLSDPEGSHYKILKDL